MRLRNKLFMGFGIVLALLTVISVWSIIRLGAIGRDVVLITGNNALMMSIKDKEVGHLDWLAKAELGLIDANARKLEVETDPHKCKFGKWYYSAERSRAEVSIPAIAGPLRDIEGYHTRLHRSAIRINEALAANDRTGANAVFAAETVPSLKMVREYLNTVNDKVKAAVSATETQALSNAARTRTAIVVLCVVAVLIGSISAFMIVYGVMKQLGGEPSEVVKAARSIAEGDLTVSIEYDRDKQESALAAMSSMTDTLEGVIAGISGAAQSLVASIGQISSGNQSLSQRTSEQASSVEEIAATLEETTAMIRNNAENAARAQEVSRETSRIAEESGKTILQAVDSINEVNSSSKRISEIISVINQIAFQTNLLALNAAVEAARAGEHGKGFAVVAEEVRNLAQRAGSSSKEISVLIQDSVSKVGRSAEMAQKAGKALHEIIQAVRDAGRLISQVATASEEQRRGIDQINIAITEIDNMTQQNAALVEETASASEDVNGQARRMLDQIQGFRISTD